MKEKAALGILFVVLVLVIPLISINNGVAMPLSNTLEEKAKDPPPQQNTQQNEENPAKSEEPPSPVMSFGEDNFRILDERTGKVITVDELTYLRGCVSAEMPPTFHPEALKAQAVASHTYAIYVRSQSRAAGQDYDFTADPQDWKVFVTEEQFYERYGEYADAYWKMICDAVDPVAHYVLLYEGEPIVAAYHSMSGGVTEDAGNVWLSAVDYLVPVSSFGDTLAPDFEKQQFYSADEVKSALQAEYPEMQFPADPSAWFVVEESRPGGYVANVNVCGETLTGIDVRTCLGLRSAAFSVQYQNGEFVFTVSGYGHGVGLSQYGADYMGRQGETFDEILQHYYTGVNLAMIEE